MHTSKIYRSSPCNQRNVAFQNILICTDNHSSMRLGEYRAHIGTCSTLAQSDYTYCHNQVDNTIHQSLGIEYNLIEVKTLPN